MNDWERRAILSSPPSRFDYFIARHRLVATIVATGGWGVLSAGILHLISGRSVGTLLAVGLLNGLVVGLFCYLSPYRVRRYEEAKRASETSDRTTASN